ncbi:hypothetical protein BDR06DRAFT_950538 [Suillus hirtellus]|nr:hypothetical protein BDR06DRAFT_950538 [Suillus hirtellus]
MSCFSSPTDNRVPLFAVPWEFMVLFCLSFRQAQGFERRSASTLWSPWESITMVSSSVAQGFVEDPFERTGSSLNQAQTDDNRVP